MTIWRPRMKAVCIARDSDERRSFLRDIGCPFPDYREVLTVTEVGENAGDGTMMLAFEGYPRFFFDGQKWAYDAADFRPLHDTTAQVKAIKRKALSPPVREPEEA